MFLFNGNRSSRNSISKSYPWPRIGGTAYEKLQQGEVGESSEVPTTATSRALHRLSPWERLVWVVTTVTLVAAICIEGMWIRALKLSSYETGFDTDLGLATRAIGLQQVVFTGGVDRHDDGSLFLNTSGSRKLYVGEPSEALEDNWEELEAAIELVLTTDETHTKGGKIVETMKEPGSQGMYRASIDVIHSLHCVNQLRKAVYAHYYFPGKPTDFFFIHMNHCVEHLRQSVECHSDLTPLTYKEDEGDDKRTPVWQSTHTCRDFTRILKWDQTRLGVELV